jgi:hypothetical protein
MKLVMLLALILPLQSFASAWNCGSSDTGTHAAHQHCSLGAPAPQAADEYPHHHCGTCCAAAIAAQPFRWSAPRPLSPAFALPRIGSPPKVTLDRLDRPPRLL